MPRMKRNNKHESRKPEGFRNHRVSNTMRPKEELREVIMERWEPWEQTRCLPYGLQLDGPSTGDKCTASSASWGPTALPQRVLIPLFQVSQDCKELCSSLSPVVEQKLFCFIFSVLDVFVLIYLLVIETWNLSWIKTPNLIFLPSTHDFGLILQVPQRFDILYIMSHKCLCTCLRNFTIT